MKYQTRTGKRKPKKLPIYFSEEEFNQVINLVKKPHHKLAFILGFHSGLRISEIVNLRKEDIDINSKRIFIRDAKGGKDRVVSLPKGFPQKYMKEIPMKFKNEKSGIRSLQIALKNYIRKAKLTKTNLHFHSLRHGFAVRWMEKKLPINQLQVLLGHEDLSTTGIYTKVSPVDALESYEELW